MFQVDGMDDTNSSFFLIQGLAILSSVLQIDVISYNFTTDTPGASPKAGADSKTSGNTQDETILALTMGIWHGSGLMPQWFLASFGGW